MRSGFTLLEVLVGLLVLALVVTAVLESQVVALRVERKARATQTLRFAAERVGVEAMLGTVSPDGSVTAFPGMVVRAERMEVGEGTNAVVFCRWSLAPEDDASTMATVVTRVPR